MTEQKLNEIENNINDMMQKVVEYALMALDEEHYENVMLNIASSCMFSTLTINDDEHITNEQTFNAIQYVFNSVIDFVDEFNAGIRDDFTLLGGDE